MINWISALDWGGQSVKGHVGRASLSLLVRFALLLVATAVLAPGCWRSAEAISTSASAVSPASSPTMAPPQWQRVSTEDAKPVKRSPRRLALPFRQIKRAGDWLLDDATDRVAVFNRIKPPCDEKWLLDVRRGTMRRIFSRPVTPIEGWWITSVETSDTWIAWEELAPGDDLVQRVEWRLYAAPLDRAALSVGEPRLITSGVNSTTSRPLFDISGTRLVWLSTTWASPGTVGESRLLVRRLDAEEAPRELYRSPCGMLTRVSTRGGEIVVSEAPEKSSRRTRVLVLGFGSDAPRAAYEVPSQFGFSHWPVWRSGRLAWATFPRPTSSVPTLYLLNGSGKMYHSGDLAVDPLFVGPYLFYEAGFGADCIRALRLRDMRSFILVEGGESLADISWSGPYSAPDLRHTYIACRIRHSPTGLEDDRTLIRIYRVR